MGEKDVAEFIERWRGPYGTITYDYDAVMDRVCPMVTTGTAVRVGNRYVGPECLFPHGLALDEEAVTNG